MFHKKAKWYPKDQLKRQIKEIEKKKGYKICGFPEDRGGGVVKICENIAGGGTNHEGQGGTCTVHGGNDGVIVTGYRSKYVSDAPTLLQLIKIKQREDDWTNCKNELIYAKSVLAKVMKDLTENKDNRHSYTDYEFVLKAVLAVGKMVEMVKSVEEKNMYTLDDVKMILSSILEVIDRNIDSVEIKKILFDDISKIRIGKVTERGKKK